MKRHFFVILVFILLTSVVTAQTTPTIDGVNPTNGAVNVYRDTDIALNVTGLNPDPNDNGAAGVAGSSLTIDNVYFYKTAEGEGAKVPAIYNTSGGGDIIVISPTQALLEANTHYTIVVTDRVTDTTGAAFAPFTSTFTTGTLSSYTPAPVSFSENAGIGSPIGKYTTLAIGPDNRLYAPTSVSPEEIAGEGPVFGKIRIFDIRPNGQLILRHTITSLQGNFMTGRIVIGLDFDPASTPDNPILWVTSNDPGFGDAPNFSGKIHRLTVSGHNTASETWTEQTFIVGLPRSVKDHMTNSVAFGPDGGLYIPQGGITAMGAPDGAWGRQPETILSAAILRVDTAELVRRSMLPNGDPAKIALPLNVATGALVEGKINNPSNGQMQPGASNYVLGDMSSPFYNPLANGAIVTLYATGVRNAYDLVWHSNGQLYVPANGSASGGHRPTTPGGVENLTQCKNRVDKGWNGDYTGPAVTGGFDNGDQRDYMFRIVPGGYYGHPNPLRCEWVLNGGNGPNTREDTRVPEYVDGLTNPDRNYRINEIFSLEYHKSPNGVIEYKSDAFNGALKNKVLVIRYSENNDIIVITPDGPENNYNISQTPMTIGSGNWYNPLDLVEDVRYGNIYISEYMNDEDPNMGRIRLLKANVPPTVVGPPNIALMQSSLTFEDSVDAYGTLPQRVEIRNYGTSNLTISSITLGGTNPGQFQIVAQPFLPMVLAPNQATVVTVSFKLTNPSNKSALLQIGSNDPDTPNATVALTGNDTTPPTPTSTPVPPTATPTPLPPTATATPKPIGGVQLVQNGGFEIDMNPVDNQPDKWKVLYPSKDRRICNTATVINAIEGTCAYRFIGVSGEQASLTQQVNIRAYDFASGDTLGLSFQYRTNKALPRLRAKITVYYRDTTLAKNGIRTRTHMVKTTSQGVYTLFQPTPLTLAGDVKKITVSFQNLATAGFIMLDDVKLTFTPLP